MRRMHMNGKFTEQAHKTFLNAEKIAREFDHDYIGTEHIFLGLLSIEESVVSKAFKEQGITYDLVYERVKEIVGEGSFEITDDYPLELQSLRSI
jgi:ATP-dependent Clp protease ATP-binding subunit ClpC